MNDVCVVNDVCVTNDVCVMINYYVMLYNIYYNDVVNGICLCMILICISFSQYTYNLVIHIGQYELFLNEA